MLSMSVSGIVDALVEQELVRKGGNDKALHFHFDLGLAHYTRSETYTARRGLHMLYHLRPGYGSVSVFSAVTHSPFVKVRAVDGWDHDTTHESCWRGVTTYSKVYFDMAQEVNSKIEEAGLAPIAPIMMTEHNTFSLFGPVYDWVDVEVTLDPKDRYQHRRIVKVL